MAYFPLFLNFSNKKILLIGAGKIAKNKLNTLLLFTSNIEILSINFSDDIQNIIVNNNLKIYTSIYKNGFIKDYDIVIVATNDIKLQEEIYKESRDYNILVNCVDNTKFCDFIFPSIIKEEEYTIAISTNGASPAFSKALKSHIKQFLPDNLNEFIKELKSYRKNMPKGESRMNFLKQIVKDYFAMK